MADNKQNTITAQTLAEGIKVKGEIQGQCPISEGLDPCVIVIFGATGDLTARKLFPSLFHLFQNGALPKKFVIMGAARSNLSREEFVQKMKEASQDNPNLDMSRWDELASHLEYQSVDYNDLNSFNKLAEKLAKLDKQHTTQGNRLFYLAVPPGAYETIFTQLGKAGLGLEQQSGLGWSRVVIEKPFGRDLESARELNNVLGTYFQEPQVFRIDHYLAKETVQNILMLRFANAIFEPVWNRVYIQSIHINALEKLGVGHRVGFYEQTGVLRDMFQNHMMQLLALCTMEPPSLFEAEQVRDEKSKVFRCIKPFPTNDLSQNLVLGQYSAGEVDGKKVPGYLEEEGVSSTSEIPTFASMKVFIENWRWQGVPIIMTSGKHLREKETSITVRFKEVPSSLFRNVLGEHVTANTLTLGVYPEEKVELMFQAKNPGPKICLRSVTMDFNYNQGYDSPILDSYEKVLMDCILGDQTLFWRQDAVEQCWSFLTPILEECDCSNKPKLHPYPAGSDGPEAALRLKQSV